MGHEADFAKSFVVENVLNLLETLFRAYVIELRWVRNWKKRRSWRRILCLTWALYDVNIERIKPHFRIKKETV